MVVRSRRSRPSAAGYHKVDGPLAVAALLMFRRSRRLSERTWVLARPPCCATACSQRCVKGVINNACALRDAEFARIVLLVPEMTERMLSERLGELAEAGLLKREVGEGPPVNVSYRLTPRGEALRPALGELERWGTEHFSGPRSETKGNRRVFRGVGKLRFVVGRTGTHSCSRQGEPFNASG